ncbi:MAG: lipoyl(octanoyl) transferase LipB [Flavobacteriaceae bacterium]|jgi:lipoyl(octanoyl) transferase|nr:lipoyl(octanoyl) transferase LipB [Flavobacteriaceae bacterium]MBT7296761.1 lipoyl(octanoyl) transferase LipB [Candidatus Woesearchaeota archaeon]MBT4298035.1 lipoyl(octanoyl) transferase LipB [Flavobacteriaceae bacterium]MBT4960287.1 lipoyl(octanoyl) transferase LipB [Flavobacteriaceae bacterium]MBT5232502.1 lipoyl(octanoyl) transferase LipB [Flavobacteriaceae bacterium]|tara:strand:- start:2182 stop:2889 length:708 start_codon:yes stop_codon:yes gene_type:complete
MNKQIIVHDLGLVDYQDALDYQLQLFNQIIDIKLKNRKNNTKIETDNHLIFVEHPNVYTLGKSGDINNLLLNKNELDDKKIQFFNTNRGGDITCHGPGQIVCYPILDLDNFFTDIHKYLRFLEETIIRTLNDFGIVSERSQNETGVWIDSDLVFSRKICAMGVKASRWVTMHGLALNVNNDLSYFENIIPCGISNKSVTSIQKETGRNISLNQVTKIITQHFIEIFSAELVEGVN